MDLNHAGLVTALISSSYDHRAPSFFSWLGVTYYLPRDIVFNTLRSIRDIAPASSRIIFDYLDEDAFIPSRTARRVQLMQEAARMSSEPMKTGLNPLTLPDELARLGLSVLEDLSPADIQARYFEGRTDGFYAFEHIHLVHLQTSLSRKRRQNRSNPRGF